MAPTVGRPTTALSLFAHAIAIVVLATACDNSLEVDDDQELLFEYATQLQPVSCNADLDYYPVSGPHNGGWDSNALNYTCPPHPSNSPDNSDFIPGDHFGNDIFAAKGTPVVAGKGGSVAAAGYTSIGGNRVTIVDACGWSYYYAHLDSIAAGIGSGMTVSAGTKIGTVGNTGNAIGTSPHLHFSIFPNGCYECGVDPFSYLQSVDDTSCGGTPTDCTPGQTQSQTCGLCGSKIRTCQSNGQWGGWGACAGQGACSPGETQTQSCSGCLIKTRTCQSNCQWGAWSACSGQGACTPGQTESQVCGNCGMKYRSCLPSCQWGAWTACSGQGTCSANEVQWQTCGPCMSQKRTCQNNCQWTTWGSCQPGGECVQGQTQSQSCGNCGSKTRTCMANCLWGAWGACLGQGPCQTGDNENLPCGNCGKTTRFCLSDCNWSSWSSCLGEGPCVSGQGDTQPCGNCGLMSRACKVDCQWAQWSDCQGQGPCHPGEKDSKPCGNCGVQSRTCGENCHWSGFGPCNNEGECKAHSEQTQSCGPCAEQTRVCNGNCHWNSWGTCQPFGNCLPGDPQSESCGDCGTRERTCTEQCLWSGWSDCQGPDPGNGDLPCKTGLGGECQQGLLECVDGFIQCLGQGEAELCDGIDNDCNDLVDDGFPDEMGNPPPAYAARLEKLEYQESVAAADPFLVTAVFRNLGLETWKPGKMSLVADTGDNGRSPSRFFAPGDWPAWDEPVELDLDVPPGGTWLVEFQALPSGEDGLAEQRFHLVGPSYLHLACPSPEFTLVVYVQPASVVSGQGDALTSNDFGGSESAAEAQHLGATAGGCTVDVSSNRLAFTTSLPTVLLILFFLLVLRRRRRSS